MDVKIVLLVLTCLVCVKSYKILGLFPYPAKSHAEVFLPLMQGLAKKGHDVTVISHFPLKESVERYKDIQLDAPDAILFNVIDLNELLQLPNAKLVKWLTLLMLDSMGRDACEHAVNSTVLDKFVKQNKQKFDVVLTEFFNNDCCLGLVYKLNAPFIGLSSCTLMPWASDRMGNPTNPSYIPDNFFDFSDKMDFLERLENAVFSFLHSLYFNEKVIRRDDKYARNIFGNDLPYLGDFVRNASLLLVNSHFSLTLPRPLVPAVIEIGGIHVGTPKPLNKDLEKWVNESKEGVIYFSLGSMIKGHTFPEEKRIEFLRAFARLPQRVLWKWESDEMPGKPDNVMIQKWMPQLDILCHPNVRAFISHGGLLGTTEAVHCGVPVVVMPQFGDQHTNAKALEANGGGVILHLKEATEEKVYTALKKVLDPEFRKGAQELSSRFKDRPLPPLETAIYWVEYVARHRGAKHMRTAAVDMPLYQYLLLDVIAFLVLFLGILTYAIFYITKAVFRRLFRKSATKQKTN